MLFIRCEPCFSITVASHTEYMTPKTENKDQNSKDQTPASLVHHGRSASGELYASRMISKNLKLRRDFLLLAIDDQSSCSLSATSVALCTKDRSSSLSLSLSLRSASGVFEDLFLFFHAIIIINKLVK